MRSRQQETEHRSVAVLGTGTMGAAMARRLLGGGARVAVWNRGAARAEPHAGAGAVVPASASDAVGDAGSGTRLKLVLNTWLAFEVEVEAAAAALATRLGIGTDVLAESVSGGPLASPFAVAKLGKISSGDHGSDFSLQWALKDLDLAAVAAGPGVAPVVAGAIARRWRELVARGHGDEDVSAAGLELGSVA